MKNTTTNLETPMTKTQILDVIAKNLVQIAAAALTIGLLMWAFGG